MIEVGKSYLAKNYEEGKEIIVKCTDPIGWQFGTFEGVVVKSNDRKWLVGSHSGYWTTHTGVFEQVKQTEE